MSVALSRTTDRVEMVSGSGGCSTTEISAPERSLDSGVLREGSPHHAHLPGK